MIAFLKDLADVLEKHRGGLFYTTNDDGVHVSINDFEDSACIGLTCCGNVSHIRDMIKQS